MSEDPDPLEYLFGVPSECPTCAGPVDYAEKGGGTVVTLCRGDCGEWSVVADE
jgi:hypothetical protein